MKTNLWMLVAVAMTSALTGCTNEAVESEEEISEATSEMRVLNGDRLTGVEISGATVNGAYLNGVNFSGMTLGGLPLSNVSLYGTVLSGRLPNGVELSGTDFISAQMTGSMSDGTVLVLRIDDITPSADADILNYKVSYLQPGGGFSGLCGTHSNGSVVQSFPLAGRYDYTQGTETGGDHIEDAGRFTLACRTAAIAKCAEAGYKPWRSVEECGSEGCQEVSLAPAHQACIRMIRADYCGDGMSHTIVGTEIDMYDAFGFQTEDESATYDLEAEWTENGAHCVVHPRWLSTDNGDAEEYIQAHCPEKYVPTSGIDCGRSGSTFFTENGYAEPLETRVFLRNKSELHQ